MVNYPASLDSSATLLTPVDKTSAKTLTTTLTALCLSGDTTLSVADAVTPGFASTDGVLSIGDELITYTGRTSTTFTGCTRGAFGTVASGHGLGATVAAKMVAGYVTRLQEAVIAIETALGVSGSYHFAVAAHGHLIADIQGLQTSLDAKAALSHTHAATDITSGTIAAARMPALTGDATTSAGAVATTVVAIRGRSVANIAPTDGQILAWNASNNRWEPGTLGVDSWIGGGDTIAEHTHIIADVTGLQDALDGKADTTHYHAAADVTSGTFDAARAWALSGDVTSSAGSGLVTVVALQSRAMAATAPTSNQAILWNSSNSEWTPTTIAISHVSGLQAAIDGKAPTSHTHAQSDVNGLVSALAGKAASVHTHIISDVTGLQAALDLATAGGPHTHAATDIVSGRLAPARMSPLAGDVGVFAPQFAEWGADEFGSGGTSLENLTELDIIVTHIRRRPVSVRAPLDRQYLQWDDTRSEWGPGSVAITDVTDLVTTLAGKAASVHTHSQSDVTRLCRSRRQSRVGPRPRAIRHHRVRCRAGRESRPLTRTRRLGYHQRHSGRSAYARAFGGRVVFGWNCCGHRYGAAGANSGEHGAHVRRCLSLERLELGTGRAANIVYLGSGDDSGREGFQFAHPPDRRYHKPGRHACWQGCLSAYACAVGCDRAGQRPGG